MQRTMRFVRTVQRSMRRTIGLGISLIRCVLVTIIVLIVGAFSGSVVMAQPVIPGLPVIPPFTLPDLTNLQPLQVPTIPEVLDQLVPPKEFPPVVDPVPPVAALSPEDQSAGLSDIQAFRAALMPSDVGDALFDHYPAGLADMTNGQIIDVRDITATAAGLVGAPVRQVTQFKFRTNDASDIASFGTASLVMPAAPWTGGGSRPIVVNNLPIDALGRACTAGYTLAHGPSITTTNVTDFIPPVTAASLAAPNGGYAVLLTDHEGPRMAYAEPKVAGQTILDSIRAMRSLFADELGDSRMVMTGYSGGAIATNGAAKLIDSYAPDLKPLIVGAALGGTPIDFAVLTQSMNGVVNAAKGVELGAGIGVAREHPEILSAVNNAGTQVAEITRDLCITGVGLFGLLPIDLAMVANIIDPFRSDLANKIYAETKMAGVKYGTPLFVYNGNEEFWIPKIMAQQLYEEQCALGTPSVLRLPFGEHVIAAVTGLPEALLWMHDRLRGVPAPSECY